MDDQLRASQGFADAIRRMIGRLAQVRPSVAVLEQATERANRFADELDDLPDQLQGWEVSQSGLRPGNEVGHSPISGPGNPIAPPMRMSVVDNPEGGHHVEATVTFNQAYEGPPRHVHGGWIAAVFDELLGCALDAPGFTAYLKVDYRRPTPLYRELELRAWVASTDGRKQNARGTCTLDGVVLSEAEGLFISPKTEAGFLSVLGITTEPQTEQT